MKISFKLKIYSLAGFTSLVSAMTVRWQVEFRIWQTRFPIEIASSHLLNSWVEKGTLKANYPIQIRSDS